MRRFTREDKTALDVLSQTLEGKSLPGLLIQLLILLLVVGVVLWGLSQFPIDPTISKLIRVIVIVIVAIYCIYLLAGFLPTAGYPLRH